MAIREVIQTLKQRKLPNWISVQIHNPALKRSWTSEHTRYLLQYRYNTFVFFYSLLVTPFNPIAEMFRILVCHALSYF
jgi:hypothetical protein